jgi:hypothetical protein
MLVGCHGDERNADALEAAVRQSVRLMNEGNWQAAYSAVLTKSQRAACSMAEYAEREGAALAMIRDSLGAGEISIRELNAKVLGNVGMVTGTALYITELDAEAVGTEGPVTGTALYATRNLGTATAENPDYWIFEDGEWRWVQRRTDLPCYNEADLETIRAVSERIRTASPD